MPISLTVIRPIKPPPPLPLPPKPSIFSERDKRDFTIAAATMTGMALFFGIISGISSYFNKETIPSEKLVQATQIACESAPKIKELCLGWLAKAATGSVSAKTALGGHFFLDPKQQAIGIDWLKEAAPARGTHDLLHSVLKDKPMQPDLFPWYVKQAESKDTWRAQPAIDTLFALRDELPQLKHSPEKAAHFTTLAAKAGNAEAQFQLGNFYLDGKGVKKDIPNALHWLDQAAQQVHEGACQKLADLYSEKNGPVPADASLSVHYALIPLNAKAKEKLV